jgi:uncharacterized membrane protein YgcG
MKHALSLWLFLWLLVSLQLPTEKGYINDLTNTLSEQQIAYLDRQLRSFEVQEGVQLIVIVVDSLEGKSIGDLAQQIAGEWQIGHKGRDSGILLLVAKKEGEAFIDLGYALDQNITDVKAQEIVNTYINPLLKKGKLEKALEVGLTQLFLAFGRSMGQGGVVSVGSFWDMTGLIIFLGSIPMLFIIAKFAASKYIWVSPTVGFIVGYTQSIGLAVVLGCMGALMVLICYLIRTFAPPRLP